jgi:protein SCO1/2
MRPGLPAACIFLACLCAAPRAGLAHGAGEAEDWAGVGLDDRTGAKVPLDIEFTDEHGVKRALGAYADRPTLVLPVYYSCHQSCSLMLESLALAVNNISLRPGRDYRVLALGIDETEGPALALAAKDTYRKLLNKELAEDDWKYLTGGAAAIRRFTDAAGYRFKRTGKHDFSHPNTLVVLARDGTIIRYLNGPDFLAFDLGMALTEAAKGTPSLAIRKMLSYCFSYDPKNKTYTFRAAQAVTLAIFLLMGTGLYFLLRRKAPQGKAG